MLLKTVFDMTIREILNIMGDIMRIQTIPHKFK